jgi:4-hydroxybenzoate polyprenyltransferase
VGIVRNWFSFMNEPTQPVKRPTFKGHLAIARLDHWVKNVFVLPGIVTALGTDPQHVEPHLGWRVLVGVLAVCLVSSSNYVINELLDAETDLSHPVKRHRPVPSGAVNRPVAYLQWLGLMGAGVALGFSLNRLVGTTLVVFWLSACAYNIPPLRLKDVPYLDVLSEAITNPLRMLAGWFMADTHSVAPGSLLLSYWMVGAYFMAIKRYAELRELGDRARAIAYRASFAAYSPERLLVSIQFYAAASMLFFGAFIMRYRLELILSFPLVALVMAVYLSLAFQPGSAVIYPETLYRQPRLMLAVLLCALVMAALMLVDLPSVGRFFSPTAPTITGHRHTVGSAPAPA